MSDTKISERKAEIRAEFDTAERERQLLVQRRSELDRNLSAVMEKIVRLQAAYAELARLEPDEVIEGKAGETIH